VATDIGKPHLRRCGSFCGARRSFARPPPAARLPQWMRQTARPLSRQCSVWRSGDQQHTSWHSEQNTAWKHMVHSNSPSRIGCVVRAFLDPEGQLCMTRAETPAQQQAHGLTACPVNLKRRRGSLGSHAATAALAAKTRLPSWLTASADSAWRAASNLLINAPLLASRRTTCRSAPAAYSAPDSAATATAATPLPTSTTQTYITRCRRAAVHALLQSNTFHLHHAHVSKGSIACFQRSPLADS